MTLLVALSVAFCGPLCGLFVVHFVAILVAFCGSFTAS